MCNFCRSISQTAEVLRFKEIYSIRAPRARAIYFVLPLLPSELFIKLSVWKEAGYIQNVSFLVVKTYFVL